MALGGGTFTTQNKPLAGTYVNIISNTQSTDELSSRGKVGVLFGGTATETFPVNTLKQISASEFAEKSTSYFGVASTDVTLRPIREIFKHATSIYLYKVDGATNTTTTEVTNHTAFLSLIQAYPVNVVICSSTSNEIIEDYIAFANEMREDYGVKLQVVVPYDNDVTAPNYEGTIVVYDNASLVNWVGGACAGCKINNSLTNAIYDGELTLSISHSQSELVTLLATGYFVFHKVGDYYRVLDDVNSLTSTEDATKSVAIMKYNQSVRIVDQIATDSAVIFNNEFLGRVQNNADGRISLWNKIVDNRKQFELLGAIENYDPADTTIEMGATKRAVVMNDVVTIVNAMAQLYLTVVVK